MIADEPLNPVKIVTGYRELSQAELDTMNKIKAKAVEVGALAEEIKAMPDADKRWASIAITELQQGFMALTRSIAKPTTF